MPTINQLIRNGRKAIAAKPTAPILQKCPQKRGVCLSVKTTTPKKPNSALRKIARVRLTNGVEGTCWMLPVWPSVCRPAPSTARSARRSNF